MSIIDIKQVTSGWANQMYTRFGGFPLYLVGSAIHQEYPRDIDIRIILPDDIFEIRYGNPIEWVHDTWQPKWREARQKWGRDVGKLSLDATIQLKMNIDFQVQPEIGVSIWYKYEPRIRLDTMEE